MPAWIKKYNIVIIVKRNLDENVRIMFKKNVQKLHLYLYLLHTFKWLISNWELDYCIKTIIIKESWSNMYTGTQTAYHCKYTPVQVWFRIKYYTIRTTNGILNIRQRQQVITHWNNLFNWCLKFKLFCIPKCVKRNLKKKSHFYSCPLWCIYFQSFICVIYSAVKRWRWM